MNAERVTASPGSPSRRTFRGTPIRVTLADGHVTVAADAEGLRRPIRVGVGGDVHELCAGDQHTFTL